MTTPNDHVRPRSARDDEHALVAWLKRLDPDAFRHAYQLYADGLYRYALTQLGDRAAAEDTVAEVFVRLLDTIERYEYRGVPLQAYLFRIARNYVVDQQRRRGRLTPLDVAPGAVSLSANPMELAEQRLTWGEMQRLLGRLTDDQRQVIVLKFVEQLDTGEIAEVMGKTENAVKSLQHRALGTLRDLLQAQYDHA